MLFNVISMSDLQPRTIKMIMTSPTAGVGKTQILKRYADNDFSIEYVPTIGVDFAIREVSFDYKPLKLQIWDTAGDERYKSITSSYFKGAKVVMVVFDLTTRDSFESLPKSFVELETMGQGNTPVILVGNKSDLPSVREVSKEEIADFASQQNCRYVEVSARDGEGIDGLFELATKLGLEKALEDEGY